jgi:hypothetical protein
MDSRYASARLFQDVAMIPINRDVKKLLRDAYFRY